MARPRTAALVDIPAILAAAQKIFMETPTNGAQARSQHLKWKIVHPTSEDATHFDPYGAICRACGGYGRPYRKTVRFMEKYGRTKYGKEMRHFFDAKGVRPADVANWFTEVINLAKEKYPKVVSAAKPERVIEAVMA